MSTLRLFADKISHPSRFCIQFLQLNKIPYEHVTVNLMRGANKAHPELPFKTLPVLKVGNDLTISQSTSILRYLSDTHPEIDENFFPKDPEKRAKVNEFMDFFHSSMNAVSYVPICTPKYLLRWYLKPMAKTSQNPIKVNFEQYELYIIISNMQY